MKQLQQIAQEKDDMATIVLLTSVFEDLASMRIRQIKNRVLQAQLFFNELWGIYSQLRVDTLFGFGRVSSELAVSEKDLYIVVTSSGGFSGDIDQRLVNKMLETYNNSNQDIIVIGRHGTMLLAQAGVPFKKYFKLPEKDHNINVEPLVREVRQYKNTVAFYQTYVSLMTQEIRRIEISAEIKKLGKEVEKSEDVISERTYIFEPSTFDVIAHLERAMLQVTLSQIIYDSKLAQYASRFRAMRSAHEKADDTFYDLKLQFNRTRRAERDEQLKQIINNLRKEGLV